jgi:hypothetical protein
MDTLSLSSDFLFKGNVKKVAENIETFPHLHNEQGKVRSMKEGGNDELII